MRADRAAERSRFPHALLFIGRQNLRRGGD